MFHSSLAVITEIGIAIFTVPPSPCTLFYHLRRIRPASTHTLYIARPLPTRPLQNTSAILSPSPTTKIRSGLQVFCVTVAAASTQPHSQTPFHHPQVGAWGVGLGWAHEGCRAGSMCTCGRGLHGVWCTSPITIILLVTGLQVL